MDFSLQSRDPQIELSRDLSSLFVDLCVSPSSAPLVVLVVVVGGRCRSCLFATMRELMMSRQPAGKVVLVVLLKFCIRRLVVVVEHHVLALC